MSLLFFASSGVVTGAVQLPPNTTTNGFHNFGTSGTVYSGIKLDADGGLYEMNAGGSWSRFATWLNVGTNSDYYVSRSINSGSLDVDAGSGPLQCNTDRIWYLTTTIRDESCNINFELSDDVSGSPVVATATYDLKATVF